MGEWNAATAEWYAERYGEYATNRLAVAALELAADAVIVDVGCGTGCALRHAAARVPKGRLFGVDPVERMVQIAEERLVGHPAADRIEIRRGAAEALPIEDDSADVVFAFDSYDHWDDKAGAFAEIRRVLRPSGELAIVKDGGLSRGPHERSAFLAALAAAGFEILDEVDLAEDGVSCTLWRCLIAD